MARLAWGSIGLATSAMSLVLAPMVVRADTTPNSASSPPGVHVVQSGDTLSQIALDAGTDIATLVSLNALGDANILAVGQSIKLPPGSPGGGSSAPAAPAAPPPPASASAQPQGNSYTVSGGDTLWDIAQRFATTTDAIVQLNHLDDPDHLSIGTALTLPGVPRAAATPTAAATSPAPAAPPTVANPPAGANATAPSRRSVVVSYTIQPGETLTQVAKQFSVRADAIAQASGLDDPNKLSVGTVVKVPVAAKEHLVVDGETLRDIAASEKVDLGSLIDFNQIDDPSLIRVGQVVLLPIAANPSAAQARATAAAPAAQAQTKPAVAQAQAQGGTQAAAIAPPPPDAAQAQAPAPSQAAPRAQAPAPSQPAAQEGQTQASAPKPSTATKPTSKPVAPLVVVAIPPGAPTDGIAGAGLKLLGSPYVWGGSSPSGFDCSGFVWYIARQTGKQLSRGMFGQYNSGSHPSKDELKPGDLVFFQNTFAPGLSHNGVYIGNNQFVHAADEAAGVTISSLTTAYWSSHWFGATRLP